MTDNYSHKCDRLVMQLHHYTAVYDTTALLLEGAIGYQRIGKVRKPDGLKP